MADRSGCSPWYMALHPSLPVVSVSLFVEGGCGAWTRLGSGTLEAMVVLGTALSPSCPQQSCRLQPLGARGSSQTLSLTC